jgi:SAM-dependent methyltransferase
MVCDGDDSGPAAALLAELIASVPEPRETPVQAGAHFESLGEISRLRAAGTASAVKTGVLESGMSFVGHVDAAGEFCLHGWAHSNTLPQLTIHVDIVINGRLVQIVPATSFREDLQLAGIGKGRKAFWFNPYEYLTGDEDVVEVFVTGTDHLLVSGRRSIRGGALPTCASQSKAESRWRGDEDGASLTWGNIITGDTFVDAIDRNFTFSPETQILEVGPGYGRLLKTLLHRNRPFRHFQGIDPSESRVHNLSRIFGSSRVDFIVGNCGTFRPGSAVDLVISSATFEHLFPSIQQTLSNLHASLRPGGSIFADFITSDELLNVSMAYFEDDELGGAFIRIYSRDELLKFFSTAGFGQIDIVHPILLGHDGAGKPIRRALVTALRG